MKKKYSEKEIISLYDNDLDIMVYAQRNNTGLKSRIEEIIGFAEQAGYKKIGIAHCISVTREAARVRSVLERQFEVVTVDCKVGRIPKDVLVGSGWGAACNPILQATVLNDEETDLNIVMGLCVGHDILFGQHSIAPSTTLLIKDEKYGNSPIKGY